MKLLFLSSLIVLAACGKEQIDRPQTCGFVFDKYYQNPPMDTTLANRTYYLRLASDTVRLPPPAPPITNWVLQVPKNIYDTMLIAGQNYPPMYCY